MGGLVCYYDGCELSAISVLTQCSSKTSEVQVYPVTYICVYIDNFDRINRNIYDCGPKCQQVLTYTNVTEVLLYHST